MPRANPILQSFNAGELSPRLVARTDFPKYHNAASLMSNLLAQPQGGVTRRPGTRYVANTKSDGVAILLPFQFSTNQAYILELGDLYMRFYRNQGRIELSGAAVEIVTPYLEADLYQLKITQSADTLYIVHPAYAPRKLVRASHTSWTLSAISFQDGPYFPVNTTTTTLELSGTTGSVTVTASAIAGINDGQGFIATDIGRTIRFKDPAGNWTWLEITGVSTTTEVDADINGPDASAGTATKKWRLGLWSDSTSYPAAVTFFEERLVLGGSDDTPQRWDASVPADFENFAPTEADGSVVDDNAISYTLAADDQSRIRWFSPGKSLVIGTAGGEFIAESDGPILTPTDATVRQHTKQGAANIAPSRVENVTLFVQKAGRKLIEEAFRFEDDSFVASDLTLLAEHITRGGIIQMAYQKEPDSIVWAVRADGRLLAMTYNRPQDVIAWTQHPLGGSFGTGGAVVESVAVIPGNNDAQQTYSSIDRDEVWLVVKRTINGATARFVEFMEGAFVGPRLEDYDTVAAWEAAMLAAQPDAFYVDAGLTYSGLAATTISNADHLEGETVKILADGKVHTDEMVASGAVTLDYSATKVQLGLPLRYRWSSLKMAYGAAAGTAVGKTGRVHRVGFVLDSTGGFYMGSDRNNLKAAEFREVADAMDTAVPLFTGEHIQAFDGGNETDPRIHIDHDGPEPFTMLAIAPEMAKRDTI